MCSDEKGCEATDCHHSTGEQESKLKKVTCWALLVLWGYCKAWKTPFLCESNTRSFRMKMDGARVRSKGPVTRRISPSSPHQTADLITMRWANLHHCLRAHCLVVEWEKPRGGDMTEGMFHVFTTASPASAVVYPHVSFHSPAQLESLLLKCLVHSVFPIMPGER